MKKSEVTRTETRSVRLSLRIRKSDSKYMKDNKLSPRKILEKAISELRNENE